MTEIKPADIVLVYYSRELVKESFKTIIAYEVWKYFRFSSSFSHYDS